MKLNGLCVIGGLIFAGGWILLLVGSRRTIETVGLGAREVTNIHTAIALPDTHMERIGRAIHRMRDHFPRTLRVEELAVAGGMGLSSFHRHFKALTSLTPLQFHKQLRLLEARRLMVIDTLNVAEAA